MSKVIGKGLRQQQKSLNERVSVIEEALSKMMVGVQKRFIELSQSEQDAKDFIEALSRLSGHEEVQAEVKALRLDRLHVQMNTEKDAMDAGVAAGYILPVAGAGPESAIVGRYIEANGVVQEPGRVQMGMPGIQEEFRAKLMGQGPGTVLDLPNGAKFEVLEVYNIDNDKLAEVQAKADADQKAAIAAMPVVAETAAMEEVADVVVPDAVEAETASPDVG
jgi:hypothetical protein